jgi:hypothetical protein
MSNKVLYKKGYLIRVTSWENDADNYKTKEFLTQSEEQAKAIVGFAWLFKSKSRMAGGIGNIYDGGRAGEVEEAQEVMGEFFRKNPEMLSLNEEEKKDLSENEDYIIDWLIDFAFDLGLSGEDYYTRVCEKVEVVYFPEDVVCTIPDWSE